MTFVSLPLSVSRMRLVTGSGTTLIFGSQHCRCRTASIQPSVPAHHGWGGPMAWVAHWLEARVAGYLTSIVYSILWYSQ
ncbi:hypothetical protein ASPBRDRAFT_46950 [Aspergillus brasiliensis CBS 101740]|uniref:Uncharacterized protein n=1 Tax=Aspergillus brasiliensis (strain CBS 101740 / IMI 381727 / IBT 21946) TaxID=767769 RepID=A0A1L9UAN4_ASPBC|nr:hypothetical protein ASPBRDRAFT_46950 [Aspergillus brasiliensis CBS 101740]